MPRLTPLLAIALATVFVGASAYAGPPAAKKRGQKSGTEASKKPGTVLTFYGLRKLEQDPKVSDEEKLKEWQAFIARATEQIAYSRKAVVRWKNAARLRVIEAAASADRDSKLDNTQKIDRWKQVARLYPKSSDARRARKRIAHWTAQETKRRVEQAEDVERARRPKVERIGAWAKVLEWVDAGPEAKAANRRIGSLQKQLFTEAQSVDRIARVDKETKLAAWKDVLAGRPNSRQRSTARARVSKLEAELGRTSEATKPARKKRPGS